MIFWDELFGKITANVLELGVEEKTDPEVEAQTTVNVTATRPERTPNLQRIPAPFGRIFCL
jgi:hypothetical protein